MKNVYYRAFTLIEILIVLSIVSLLSSIVFTSLSNAREKAQDVKMRSEAKQVRTSIEQYRQDMGFVPAPDGQYVLGTMVSEDTDEYRSAMQKLVPEYLTSIPTSHIADQPYRYLVSLDGQEAVFAVELNNSDASGNFNSCDIIEPADPVSSCTFIDTSIEGYDPENYDCDVRTYDPETQICIDGQFSASYCISNDKTCSWDLADPSLVSSQMCDNLWLFPGCEYPPQVTDGENGLYICNLGESSNNTCSGVSDNDYCSCI